MTRVLLLALLLPLAAIGCGATRPTGSGTGAPAGDPAVVTAEPGDSLTLARGQTADVGGRTLRFDAVVEDSRCPREVTCVWAGRARIALTVGGTGGDGALTLELPGMTDGGGPPVEAYGHTFTLLALDPYPRSGDAPEDGPRATLRVERVAG